MHHAGSVIGVFAWLPAVKRHGHPAPGDAQVVKVILNLGRVGRALNAEVAAHAVVLATGSFWINHQPGRGFVHFARRFDRESGANSLSVG